MSEYLKSRHFFIPKGKKQSTTRTDQNPHVPCVVEINATCGSERNPKRMIMRLLYNEATTPCTHPLLVHLRKPHLAHTEGIQRSVRQRLIDLQ